MNNQNSYGSCISCHEYPCHTTDGLCDKCQKKYIERCKAAAQHKEKLLDIWQKA